MSTAHSPTQAEELIFKGYAINDTKHYNKFEVIEFTYVYYWILF